MAGLNLLPWRAKERELKKKQFLGIVAATVVGTALGVFAGRFYVQTLIENQEARNKMLETEISQLESQIAQIKVLEATRNALLERMKIIENLQSTRPSIVHLFDEMVNALPKGLYLVHLQQEATTVRLEGKAESYARVSSYMNQLDASPWFSSSNLNIISTDNKADPNKMQLRDFKMDVKQLLTENSEAQEEETGKSLKKSASPKPAHLGAAKP